MRFTTVLFDLDLTLYDSDTSFAAAFDTTVRSVGLEPTDEVFAVFDRINGELWGAVEAGRISPNDVRVTRFERLTGELGVAGDAEEMGATFLQVLTDVGELYPGAAELLDDLSNRFVLGMVTNGIGSVQRGRIARLGLERHFDAISISGELAVSKPGRAIFDHTLAQLGATDRSEVVMIGDSLSSDIAGARNAGIASIWFNPNGAEHGETVPTHQASTLEEIHALLTE